MKKTLLVLAGVSMISASDVSFAADVKGESSMNANPNAMGTSNDVQVEAKVVKVDKKTREITFQAEDGEQKTVVAGDEVRNFNQIKKGDILRMNYRESLMWELRKGGGAPVSATESTDIIRAEPGQKPGGTITERVTAVGTVTKVDSKKQAVTVRGPKRTVVLKVPKEDVFKNIKVGDQIEAVYTEALAVSVEKVKK